jgi:peptidoglycan/LPS O-acetylase OafA/YrhL
LMAVPVTFVLALISCHAIEQPAMRPKRAVAAWIASWMASFSPRRAAVLGAKASFVIGTVIILLSADRSWQFLESMGQLLIGVLAGTILAAALDHAAGRLGIREAAIWRGKV